MTHVSAIERETPGFARLLTVVWAAEDDWQAMQNWLSGAEAVAASLLSPDAEIVAELESLEPVCAWRYHLQRRTTA